jgi:hypothetical protein
MMRIIFFCLAACLLFLSSFHSFPGDENLPKTITRTLDQAKGKTVENTVILIDCYTSREDIIQTCNFLAKENVQLTFSSLIIGKTFLGLVGKQRIRIAEGMIKLPNGSSQSFKAGGITAFRVIKIQYSNDPILQTSQIEMVEVKG